MHVESSIYMSDASLSATKTHCRLLPILKTFVKLIVPVEINPKCLAITRKFTHPHNPLQLRPLTHVPSAI